MELELVNTRAAKGEVGNMDVLDLFLLKCFRYFINYFIVLED